MTAHLPSLREELAVLSGPCDHNGAPTWMLHDPLSNKYFNLSWPAFEVLNRWHLGQPQAIADSITEETPLDLEVEDILDVAEFLARSQLLKTQTPENINHLLAIHDTQNTSWFTWLLHHYIFFRVHLVHPDAFLERLMPFVSWMGSKGFRITTFAAFTAGLFFIIRQWDIFKTTFVDHFSISGMVTFGVALGFAKIAHEFGHALTAKSFGCRVPTMGLAFLVLWPILYTDVNEVWKLNNHKQRQLVSSAGILTELTIAAWASLAWGLLPDGAAKSMAFTLAATTWISSLAINLSPFMRFDGYFLIMDILGQANLHPRSFALARWHLREVLFDLKNPVPENLPRHTRNWMIIFAWMVWVYRLTLFLGIAILVYHFFIKAVGILLFTVEIGWFVIKPLWGEFKEWGKTFDKIRSSKRVFWPISFLALLILIIVIPWSGRVSAPALLKADKYVAIYAPFPAILHEITVNEGQKVEKGAGLVQLIHPDTDFQLEQIERRIKLLKYELSAIGFEETFRNRTQAITEELLSAIAEKSALLADISRLTLNAPITGIVTDLSPYLQHGQWINSKEPILGVRSGIQIEAYISEEDLPRIAIGARSKFIPEGSLAAQTATITNIDYMDVKSLDDPSMAAQYGGDILARFDHNNLVPDASLYRVRLSLPDTRDFHMPIPIRGQIHIEGERRSIIGHAIRTIAATLIREWSS